MVQIHQDGKQTSLAFDSWFERISAALRTIALTSRCHDLTLLPTQRLIITNGLPQRYLFTRHPYAYAAAASDMSICLYMMI